MATIEQRYQESDDAAANDVLDLIDEIAALKQDLEQRERELGAKTFAEAELQRHHAPGRTTGHKRWLLRPLR